MASKREIKMARKAAKPQRLLNPNVTATYYNLNSSLMAAGKSGENHCSIKKAFIKSLISPSSTF